MNGSFDDYDSVIDGNSFAIGRIHHGNDDYDDVSSIHMSEIGSQITSGGNSYPYGSSGNGSGHRDSRKNHGDNVISGKRGNGGDLGIDASDVSAILGVYSNSNRNSDRNSNATYYSTDASQGEHCDVENNLPDIDNDGNNKDVSGRYDGRVQKENTSKNVKLGPLGDELSFAGNEDDDDNDDNNEDQVNWGNPAEAALERACIDKNGIIYDEYGYYEEEEEGFLPNWIYKSSRKMKCLVVVSLALFMGSTVVAGVALAMANSENNSIGGNNTGGGATAAIEDGITEGERIITPTLSPSMATNVATNSLIPTKSPVLSSTGEMADEEIEMEHADQHADGTGDHDNSKTNYNEVNNPTTARPKTSFPSKSPIKSPMTQPLKQPVTSPTRAPITANTTSISPTTSQPPTEATTISSTTSPTTYPTATPTTPPTTSTPTIGPSRTPTISPTDHPPNAPTTNPPTTSPSETPSSAFPTASPSWRRMPTAMPSSEPSLTLPTGSPTLELSSLSPTFFPTSAEDAFAIDDNNDNDDDNGQVGTMLEGINMGTEATIEGDATFYLMSDGANNVAFWESQLSALDVTQSGAKFLVHL